MFTALLHAVWPYWLWHSPSDALQTEHSPAPLPLYEPGRHCTQVVDDDAPVVLLYVPVRDHGPYTHKPPPKHQAGRLLETCAVNNTDGLSTLLQHH